MFNKLSSILVLLLTISGLGCDEADNPSSDVNQKQAFIQARLGYQFQLKVKQTASIGSENIKISFLNVPGDSRCPSDVVCIWAGEVKILVNVSKDDKSIGDLILVKGAGNDGQATATFDGYSVTLVNVDPYPVSTRTIALSDYTITLVVAKT